jgi:glycosyltransferase involved in cell wall biosynthesis
MFASEDRWSVFSEMDILLMATRDAEPYGRVIQEAAAVGAPAIAPNVAGIGEQIRDGIDGLLYEFRDGEALERQMARVISEPELVRELAANLWPVVDTRDAVAEIERFYLNILGVATEQSVAMVQS